MTNDKYGPQTPQIEKILERIRTLTPDEFEKLTRARSSAKYKTWFSAWYAARDAVWGTASWSEAWDAAWYDALYAAYDAMLALSVSHLAGRHGLTKAHLDLLAGPWREVIGEFEESEGEIK